LVGFVLFIIRIGKSPIKERSPFLILISAIAGLIALVYMFFRNFLDLVLPCPLTYYILMLMIVLFFLPYLFRCFRTILMWDLTQAKAAGIKTDSKDKSGTAEENQKRQVALRRKVKIYETLSNEYLLVAILGVIMFVWMGFGTMIWGILYGAGTPRILDPLCQKYCYSAEGWALRSFIIILAIMICVYLILLLRMIKINDAFSIRDELAFLCFYSIIMVIGCFINMVIPNSFWPATPWVGFVLAAEIVGAYVVSVIWPLIFPIVEIVWYKIKTCNQPGEDESAPQEDTKTGGSTTTTTTGGAPKSGKISFEEILSSPIGREHFKQFLVREFSVENLMFYTEVDYFTTLTDQSEIRENAKSIFETYVDSGAPFEIHIDQKERDECQKTLESNLSVNAFNNAKKSVFNSMQENSYPRFMKSKLYRDMLTAMAK